MERQGGREGEEGERGEGEGEEGEREGEEEGGKREEEEEEEAKGVSYVVGVELIKPTQARPPSSCSTCLSFNLTVNTAVSIASMNTANVSLFALYSILT